MTVSSTDIGNRALQLLGTRTNMASLGETSNEAVQVSLAYSPVTNWAFGLSNWNFGRKVAILSVNKGPPPSPAGTWSATYPQPPWLYSYVLPADMLRALYLTNSDAAPIAGWVGEPKRFVLGYDLVSAADAQVLLTNESPAILVYNSVVANPTAWPWYFERLAVVALAHTLCMGLTGDKKLLVALAEQLEQQISIAVQSNAAEGLIVFDSTPEWIQALGIEYPYRRIDSPMTQQLRARRQQRDDQ
jgi:hypothetical protein